MSKRILIDATNVNILQPGGGSYCTRAYLEAFLALYPGKIDVLHPAEAHIRDNRYTTIDVPGRSFMRAAFGIPKGYLHRAAELIVRTIQQHPDTYDTLVISTGLYAGGVLAQIKQYPIRTIILHHNFEPEYRMDSASILTLRGRTDRFVRYWEQKGYLQASINLFLTQYDLELFEKEYGPHPHNYVIGIFEPTSERQQVDEKVSTNSAVITCALSDIQNQAPLLRFEQTYLPVFREVLPKWHIELMGRQPSEKIREMAKRQPCIHLTPDPEDIQSLAARSKIYLCPMDGGGGLKLRIMDGLRNGQPILAHQRAARGYDALTKEPFFYVYSDEESFRTQLKQAIQYIQSDACSRRAIQDKYYNLFGLSTGIERLKAIICK